MNSPIHYLRLAGLCFIILGLCYFVFGFPFWFLGAVDEPANGKLILPFLFLINHLLPETTGGWAGLIGTTALLIGQIAFWKSGEPTGMGKQRNFFYVPIIGAFFYFLSSWMPLPFAPLGAFFSGLGMILVGVVSIKAKIWTGWKRYMPLIVGCFPFVFMFPLLLITGNRPAAIIGFWGIPWIGLGIAAWQQSKQLSDR